MQAGGAFLQPTLALLEQKRLLKPAGSDKHITIISNGGVLVPVIFVLGVIGFIVSPAFLTEDNLIGVVQQSTELGLLVLGEALILISGA
ncbi:hypothetical protein SANTM175S_02652 [Streptomyces antimycoticus]